MMKNVVDVCMGALGFWAIGWALAYGVDPTNPDNVNSFCGTGEWFMIEGFDYAVSVVFVRACVVWAFEYTNTIRTRCGCSSSRSLRPRPPLIREPSLSA